MTRRTRLAVMSGLASVSVCLAMAALAWACTPQAFISVSPSSGPPGTVVTVSGHGFVSGGRVEVRMGAVDSAPIATATGPTFSIPVTIPQGATGVPMIGAAGYDTSGQEVGTSAQAFQVTGTAPPPVVSPTPNPPHGTPPPVSTGHPGTPRVRQQPGTGAQPAPGGGGTVSAPAASAKAGVRFSVAPQVLALPQAPVHKAPGPAPNHRLGSSAPVARPALAQGWPAPTAPASLASGGGGNQLAFGIGLLGVGLVALLAGFTVAEVRRRRAAVRLPR